MSGEIAFGDPVLPERFWDKVHPEPLSGCWLWGAAVHSSLPYGIWRIDGRNARAHVSTFLANGGVLTADRPNVLHSCDVPCCVRPAHLRAGDQRENINDARIRDRLPVGTGSRLTSADVVAIRERYAANERSAVLAEDYGISESAISLIVRGEHWASAGGPLTFGRKLGHPSPRGEQTHCSRGHELTPDNVRLKPNKSCRSGFERLCIKCRQVHSQKAAAKRKADRAARRNQGVAA